MPTWLLGHTGYVAAQRRYVAQDLKSFVAGHHQGLDFSSLDQGQHGRGRIKDNVHLSSQQSLGCGSTSFVRDVCNINF